MTIRRNSQLEASRVNSKSSLSYAFRIEPLRTHFAALDMTGDQLRAIDGRQDMDLDEFQVRYRLDRNEGYQPFLVVGSAGTASTGPSALRNAFSTMCRYFRRGLPGKWS